MQYLKYRKSVQSVCTMAVKKIVCCLLKPKSHEASCTEPTGCVSQVKCVVESVKSLWVRAGLPIMSDYSISLKVTNLYEEWQRINKNKNRMTATEQAKRDSFIYQLNSLFDISHPEIISLIKNDRLRSESAREEDIQFYHDQKSERISSMSGLDHKYEGAVMRKYVREVNELKRYGKIIFTMYE